METFFFVPWSVSNPQDWKIWVKVFFPFLFLKSWTISCDTLYLPSMFGAKTRRILDSIAFWEILITPGTGWGADGSLTSGMWERQGVATGCLAWPSSMHSLYAVEKERWSQLVSSHSTILEDIFTIYNFRGKLLNQCAKQNLWGFLQGTIELTMSGLWVGIHKKKYNVRGLGEKRCPKTCWKTIRKKFSGTQVVKVVPSKLFYWNHVFLRLQSSENKTSIPTKQQGRCQAGVFPVHPGFYPVEPPQSDFQGL